MEIIYRNLSEMKPHPDNPRARKGENSIAEFAEKIKTNPKHFEARPILLSNRTGELVIIGGERRWESAAYLGWQKAPSILIEGLTQEEEYRILVEDNTHTGIWDVEKLKKWTKEELLSMGLKPEELRNRAQAVLNKETNKLSEMEYRSMYFQPTERPQLKLIDCIDFEKFNAKMAIVDNAKLPKKMKDVLRWFCYRFIKIDFESVANYYYFNASEEEKKVIERLRLVLVDGGGEGFIEDDLLRISKLMVDRAMLNDE